MKKLLIGLGIVVLSAGANIFADAVSDYTKWSAVINNTKNMDPKFLSINDLCNVKKYIDGSSELNSYITSLESLKYTKDKASLLKEFRSYINTLKYSDKDILSVLKGDVTRRIKQINPNAACLK